MSLERVPPLQILRDVEEPKRLKMLDDEQQYQARGLLAHLIADHKEALLLLKEFEERRERPGLETGSPGDLINAAMEETRARRKIVFFRPRSRREAMSKLAYLSAVLVATHTHLDDEELAELAASIARFKDGTPSA